MKFGISTFSLLGILFVALKLTEHIDWSWFWVTIPFWGGLALGLAIMFVGAVGLAIVAGFTGLVGLLGGLRSKK